MALLIVPGLRKLPVQKCLTGGLFGALVPLSRYSGCDGHPCASTGRQALPQALKLIGETVALTPTRCTLLRSVLIAVSSPFSRYHPPLSYVDLHVIHLLCDMTVRIQSTTLGRKWLLDVTIS